MSPKPDSIRPADASFPLVNDPPVDPRKPPPNLQPGSHTTGGAKDHQLPHEGDGSSP